MIDFHSRSASAMIIRPEPTPNPAVAGVTAPTGCALAVLVGVLAFACVWSALSLGIRGELTWRLGQPTELRVWLLRGDGLAGLGWSWAQVRERRGAVVCVTPHVAFWTWRGEVPEAAPGIVSASAAGPPGGRRKDPVLHDGYGAAPLLSAAGRCSARRLPRGACGVARGEHRPGVRRPAVQPAALAGAVSART